MTGDKAYFRPDIPSTARMYDYYLGGKDNYPVDRDAAEQVIKMMPPGTVRMAAIQNRKFIGRTVRYLAGEMNIRQFLDIGTGLPTMNNVHEVAQSVNAACRVVYVDHDPVVLAHARQMLDGVQNTTIVGHDLREPSAIIGDPEVRDLLDFGRPTALLLVAVLHFIGDSENPRELIGALMEPMPAGSHLVISHATNDSCIGMGEAEQVYTGTTSRLRNRTQAEVAALFEGLELLEPGIAWLSQWRPDRDTGLQGNPSASLGWCGVGRKAGGLLLERACVRGNVDGMLPQHLKRNDLQCAFMRGCEHHGRRGAVPVRPQPVHGGHAPSVAGHQSGEAVLRHRRGQVITDAPLVFKELRGHHRADAMAAEILRSCVAASVAVEAGDGVSATRLQVTTQHVTVAHP